jgi:hypothetical protein
LGRGSSYFGQPRAIRCPLSYHLRLVVPPPFEGDLQRDDRPFHHLDRVSAFRFAQRRQREFQ